MVTDERWFDPLRAELPVLQRYVYLNTGTAGPLPRCVATAMQDEADYELHEGRGNFATFERVASTRERARALVGRLLGARPAEIALTHHTTDGINIVLGSIDWRAGDVIVTTALEHDAIAVPLGMLRRRYGVELRFADIGLGERAQAGLEAALAGPAPRLVLLSHIAYSTGALLPVREMIELCHRAGAAVLVDGAQSCGVLPLDVAALDADYYTVSGQKWLCGPEGTGALFVRESRLDELVPAATSYFSAAHHDYRGNVTLHPTARRCETGMMHRPSMAGFAAALAWMLDEVQIPRAWQRSLALAAQCRQRLSAIDGIRLLTPDSQLSPLVSCAVPAWSPARLRSAALQLAERHQIVCRSIDHPPYALRASIGFFNTEQEIDRFAVALADMLAASS